MAKPRYSDHPSQQRRANRIAARFRNFPRQHLVDSYETLNAISHRALFILDNDTVVRRTEVDGCQRDLDSEFRVATAIVLNLVEVQWNDAAAIVINDNGMFTAYPLTLTPLGVEAQGYIGDFLHER